MIPARDTLQQFEHRARSGTPFQRLALRRVTSDMSHNRTYVVGLGYKSIHDVLADADRRVYSYYCARRDQLLGHRRPHTSGFPGSFAGRITWDDWALIVLSIESCAGGQAGTENVDLASVRIPVPAWSVMLITACDNQLEPLFLFPHDLSPIQGFALLNEAMQANRGAAEEQFINQQETPQ